MVFDGGIDPAYDLTVENSSEGDAVGGARSLIDALAKISRRTGIAELAT
jgi:hypothetical protein